jgi:ABC-2 type transport system permease protein
VQFRAIAWVRWRLLVNSFRRKGGKGELIARILILPFIAIVAVGPIVGAGALGFYAVHNHAAWAFSALTWAVFLGWIFVASATTLHPDGIDLSLLLRFPVRFSSYVVIRFFFGLLATPNVVGSLALLSAAIGIGAARPMLSPWAAIVLGSYGLMMILLLRMVLLWLDRWLAQRKTREIAGVVFTMFFLAFQYANSQVQGWARHRQHGRLGMGRFQTILPVYRFLHPVVAILPPTLASDAITAGLRGALLPATAALAGVIAFCCVFGALFALRLRGEFRGENFNEAPPRTAVANTHAAPAQSGLRFRGVSPAIAACIEKELRYLVRGPSLLITVLTPLVLVGIYANRMGSFELLLPCAMAYTLFSLLPLLYNVLGQDAAGAQLYLMSPTPLHEVFLAKNLVTGGLITCVAGAAAVIVSYGHRPSAPIAVGTLFWFAFLLLTNLSFGNLRSVQSPMKVDMNKTQRRRGASQMSVLIVLGVLLGSLALGFALLWGCRYVGHIWAAPVLLLLLAAAALAIYVSTLHRMERAALANRDVLVEVLGKAA